jgi:hypothetical protein
MQVLYKPLSVLSVMQPGRTGRIPSVPRTGLNFSDLDPKILSKNIIKILHIKLS